MSKMTNEEYEPSVSCGFFNSLGDRQYASEDFGKLFDGVITDGIFATIGSCFAVTPSDTSGNEVIVGTGKCWFNNTWTENIVPLPINCGNPPVADLNRYDAIVIRVDKSDPVRDNFIEVVRGADDAEPAYPDLTDSDNVFYHPLCYVYRRGGADKIGAADITDVRGEARTGYVTGLPTAPLPEETWSQWNARLDILLAEQEQEVENFKTAQDAEYNEFQERKETEYNETYNRMVSDMTEAGEEFKDWSENQKTTILEWYDSMKGQLTTDAATNLQMQIDNSEVEQILMHGFSSGTKEFSTDGTIITSKELVEPGRTLVKTFTNGFATSTTVLTDKHGSELGRLVKNFSEDGSITSKITIF